MVAHQTAFRAVTLNRANNVAVFGNLNVRKYDVDIDGLRYPWDSVSFDYTSNEYLEQ